LHRQGKGPQGLRVRREGIGGVSHETNVHDAHTLPAVLDKAIAVRDKSIDAVVCDRGYRGVKAFGETQTILPSTPLKRDYRLGRCYSQGPSRRPNQSTHGGVRVEPAQVGDGVFLRLQSDALSAGITG